MEAINSIEPERVSLSNNNNNNNNNNDKLVISIPIPIPKSHSYDRKKIIAEYSLKCNNFNPSKMSPPDHWKGRLQQRICRYYNTGSNEKYK